MTDGDGEHRGTRASWGGRRSSLLSHGVVVATILEQVSSC